MVSKDPVTRPRFKFGNNIIIFGKYTGDKDEFTQATFFKRLCFFQAVVNYTTRVFEITKHYIPKPSI